MTDRAIADRLPQLYYALDCLKVDTGAFSQLTRQYMKEDFNPRVPDMEDVRFVFRNFASKADRADCGRYFSYGATFDPGFWSVFRHPHYILEKEEGYNDGLVSVASSMWGGEQGYKGTLSGVSHLDLINWTNRLKWMVSELSGNKRK